MDHVPFFSRLFRFVRHFADVPYYVPFRGRNKEYLSSRTLLSQLLTQLLKPEMARILLKIIGHFRNQNVGQRKDLVGNVRCPTLQCHSISMRAVLKSDWSRGGLRIDLRSVFISCQNQLPSSRSFNDSNVPEKKLSEKNIYRKQKYVIWIKMFGKLLEMLGKIFNKIENYQKR